MKRILLSLAVAVSLLAGGMLTGTAQADHGRDYYRYGHGHQRCTPYSAYHGGRTGRSAGYYGAHLPYHGLHHHGRHHGSIHLSRPGFGIHFGW
jgi:hypothetical protein